jgi:hypothetical protein
MRTGILLSLFTSFRLLVGLWLHASFQVDAKVLAHGQRTCLSRFNVARSSPYAPTDFFVPFSF